MADDNGRGRPRKYIEDYSRQAFVYCKNNGANDKGLCELFNIAESTLNRWKHDFPEFWESIKKGKDIYDTEVVEKSLLERAIGYSHEDTKFFCHEGIVISEEYTKHYPPDPTSAIFYLKNRNPGRWKDKVEHKLDEETLNALLRGLPEEFRKAVRAELDAALSGRND